MPRENSLPFSSGLHFFSLNFLTHVRFKFPTKPRGPIWQHFYIVQQGPTLLLSTAKCKYCTWEHLGHSGKMEAHLAKCLGFSELKAKSDLKGVEHGAEAALSPSPSKKPKPLTAFPDSSTIPLQILSRKRLPGALRWPV